MKNSTNKDNLSPKNIARRLKGETPDFFKKIIWIGISVGTTCLACRVGLSEAGIEVSDSVNRLFEIGIAVGVVATAISKLTMKPNESKD